MRVRDTVTNLFKHSKEGQKVHFQSVLEKSFGSTGVKAKAALNPGRLWGQCEVMFAHYKPETLL
jgi:hypothetical protein